MAAAYRNEPEILPFLAVDGAVCRVRPASKSLSDDVSGASRKAAAKTRARSAPIAGAPYVSDPSAVRTTNRTARLLAREKLRLFADRRQSLQAAHLRIVQAAEVIGVGPQIAVYQRPGETVAEAELGLDRGRRAAANGFR